MLALPLPFFLPPPPFFLNAEYMEIPRPLPVVPTLLVVAREANALEAAVDRNPRPKASAWVQRQNATHTARRAMVLRYPRDRQGRGHRCSLETASAVLCRSGRRYDKTSGGSERKEDSKSVYMCEQSVVSPGVDLPK